MNFSHTQYSSYAFALSCAPALGLASCTVYAYMPWFESSCSRRRRCPRRLGVGREDVEGGRVNAEL